jgi:hypothetical protein
MTAGRGALNVVEGSAVPSDQFWGRLNKSCEPHPGWTDSSGSVAKRRSRPMTDLGHV